MNIEFARRTLAKEISFEGAGLHSGSPVSVKVEPGDRGIVFHCGSESVGARPENVTDTSRCTRLGPVSTVEHIMSAFGGLGVTDAEVLLSAPELPALDGASEAYCLELNRVGLVEIGRALFQLFERVFYVEDPIRIGLAKGEGHWRFDFVSGDRWPHDQSFECTVTPENYATEIAPARTFAFEEEVEPIRLAGLAKGLDERSALVLGVSGYINPPKWPDEPARHKLLDLIGDLYLSGVPPHLLNVVGARSGHRTNVEAAKRLADHAVISV